jgi:hypothetical protein
MPRSIPISLCVFAAALASAALAAGQLQPSTAKTPAPGQLQPKAAKPAAAQPPKPSVRVINRSEPVLCAEKDNVSILFQSPEVRQFAIEAAHPNYIDTLQRDSWDADWTNCDMSGDPVVPAQPREVRMYDSGGVAVVGVTYPSFWRKNDVAFRVGDRVEPNLHLVQIFFSDKTQTKPYEVLAMYPPDGYWRAHPLPPPQLKWTAYGSSFLVGPIDQEAGRPVVNLKEIAFDPAERSFTLQFKDGTSGTLRLLSLDHNRVVLNAELQRPVGGGRPFAVLRSMYVTEYNADAARIALKTDAAKGWREDHVMRFESTRASDVWIGRLVPSRHNTSAPDMVFHRFER